MPSTATRAKRKKKARKPKARARRLTHSQLLKLAAKHRPPQSWYDEQIDPMKPQLPLPFPRPNAAGLVNALE